LFPVFLSLLASGVVAARPAPRERVSIDDDWRFTSGDPANMDVSLLYDIRQERAVRRAADGRWRHGPPSKLRWDGVVYQPPRSRLGCRAAETMETAGSPAQLELIPDRAQILWDGRDLSFVTVVVRDRKGRTVPRADNLIHFSAEGEGEIVATDNGDSASFESFQSHDRKAFNGLCLVIVRGDPKHIGTIKLVAGAAGLKDGAASIRPLRTRD
jgi:hypothetical protein